MGYHLGVWILVLGLVAAVFVLWPLARPAPEEAGEGGHRQAQAGLVSGLARIEAELGELEEDYGAGKIALSDYQRLRLELIDQAAVLVAGYRPVKRARVTAKEPTPKTAVASPEVEFCPYCGAARLSPDQAFCHRCGHKWPA